MADVPYLERCVETISHLKELDISSMTLGEYIGAGSLFKVCSLGRVSLDDTMYLGLKLPKTPKIGESAMRLSQEVARIDKILERVPRIADRPPLFMGLLAIDTEDNDVAIITEDVTEGYTLPIRPTPACWPKELEKGLGGEYGNDINEEVINSSIAFDVDGNERWLDFTPSPFGLASINNPIYDDMDRVNEKQKELTVTVPADSPLALSMS